MTKNRKLTERQRRFGDEYVRTGEIYQSAINAGYTETYAKAQSYKLLENIGIKAYIDKRLNDLKKESIAEQDEIMQFLTSVMRGEITEPIPVLSGNGHQKVVSVVPNAQARKSAAEQLGKRYSMWTDKKEVMNTTPTFIEDVPEDD